MWPLTVLLRDADRGFCWESGARRRWIATQDGAVRLDGYDGDHHATVFRRDRADSGSLSNSWVWDLAEDRRGKLWLATSNGLNRFDPDTETFQKFFHDPDDLSSLPSERVWTLYVDGRQRARLDSGLVPLWRVLRALDSLQKGSYRRPPISDRFLQPHGR